MNKAVPLTAFDRAFSHVVGVEGDGSGRKVRNDRGGATRWGITERTARACGYTGPMSALPFETARMIYESQWWRLMKLDAVASMSYPIAVEMFDTGVNCSQSFAVTSLQRALNLFNRQARDYQDIEADGVMGKVTLYVLGEYLRARGGDGEAVMLRALNTLQGARYIDIGERDSSQEDFEFGWFLNRVS